MDGEITYTFGERTAFSARLAYNYTVPGQIQIFSFDKEHGWIATGAVVPPRTEAPFDIYGHWDRMNGWMFDLVEPWKDDIERNVNPEKMFGFYVHPENDGSIYLGTARHVDSPS